MKSKILLLLLLLGTTIAFGQSKKDQIRSLEEENAALKETVAHKEALLIEQKARIEASKGTLSKQLFDIEMLGEENAALRSREKALLDSLKECNQFPPLIQSLRDGIQEIEFEDFWSSFSKNCYSGKNIDALIYKGAKPVMQYVHDDLPFRRKYNLGAICNLHEKAFNYGYFVQNGEVGKLEPQIEGMRTFDDAAPIDGFCDPSPSPDGIYIKRIAKLEYWDMQVEDLREVKFPAKFKGSDMREVTILKDHMIQKKLYFIQADGKWWFFLADDCDCSA